MRVSLRIDGRAGGGRADIPLAPTQALLEALDRSGSLQGVASELGISYRSAWGQLAALEHALGRPAAVKTKGHGSALTPLGNGLLALLKASQVRLGPALAAEEMALADGLRRLLEPGMVRIRLAASHDPLLLDALETRRDIDLMIAGSLDALARLREGAVDAAGFHYGAEGPPPPPFDILFSDPEWSVESLFRREQGLLFAPGNPLGLTDVASIAERKARFVNRQRGAGTRIWFERLCREAGVPLDSIVGHHTEEFTHQAVAALIATGAADVGMGTRAVAERFTLDFRPLGWETYHLVVRATLPPERLAPLREQILKRAQSAPGYAPPAAHQSRA